MRVILADDSELIIERLLEALSIYKQVEIAGVFRNGKDALDAIKTLKPDMAILDIQMPGLTGLEILHEIRKEGRIPKIMILTLYSSDYYRNLALTNGADYFFSKVDEFEKVSQVIDTIC